MRRISTWMQIVPAGVLLMLSCLGCGLIPGRSEADLPDEVATEERSAVSPSEKYILSVVSGHDSAVTFKSFYIIRRDRMRDTMFAAPERFRTRDTTYFLWDEDDRVWVYSGDVGTFFWEYDADLDEWVKTSYVDSDVPAPPFLKEVKPEYHPR